MNVYLNVEGMAEDLERALGLIMLAEEIVKGGAAFDEDGPGDAIQHLASAEVAMQELVRKTRLRSVVDGSPERGEGSSRDRGGEPV